MTSLDRVCVVLLALSTRLSSGEGRRRADLSLALLRPRLTPVEVDTYEARSKISARPQHSARCGQADADEIRVMTSGAFTAALRELTAQFERATKNKVETTYGASMGTHPTRFRAGSSAEKQSMS